MGEKIFNAAFDAAGMGDLYTLKQLINEDAGILSKDKFGCTLLMKAAGRGQLEAVNFLTAKGVDIDQNDNDGQPALYYGITRGHEEVVDFLVAQKRALVSKDCAMLAASKGYMSPLEAFVSYGEEFPLLTRDTRPNFINWTFVMHAASGGHMKLLKWLIRLSRGHLNAKDSMGYTALFWALHNNQEEAARLLINNGSRIDFVTAMKAVKHGSHFTLKEYLSQSPASINERGSGGLTLLMEAAAEGHLSMVSLLLSVTGVDVFAKNDAGRNALFMACVGDHAEVAAALMEHGSEIDISMIMKLDPQKVLQPLQVYWKCGGNLKIKDVRGQSLLIWAAFQGLLEIVAFLVEKVRCDLDEQDNEDHTAIDWACFAGQWGVVNYLIGKGANGAQRIAMEAAEEGRLSTVQAYIETGAEANQLDSKGLTLLMRAAMKARFGLMRWLITDGKAKMLVTSQDGHTAIHYGFQASSAEFLLEISSTIVDCEGNTLLHVACATNHLTLLEHLVQDGKIRPDLKNFEGMNAALIAAKRGHRDVLRALIAHKLISIDATSNKGIEALHVACRWGHLDIVRFVMDECSATEREKRRASLAIRYQPQGVTCLMEACRWGWISIVKYLIDGFLVSANLQCAAEGNTALHLAAENGHTDIVLYFLSKAESKLVNLHVENHKGVSAMESILMNKIIPAIPQIMKIHSKTSDNFLQTQYYLRSVDASMTKIGIEFINLLPTLCLIESGCFLTHAQCTEQNLLVPGTCARQIPAGNSQPKIKILLVSHRWESQESPDPTHTQYGQLLAFLSFMQKEHGIHFDYIWMAMSCLCEPSNSERYLKEIKTFPSIFFLATHFLVLTESREESSGDWISDLAGVSGRGWCQLEILLGLCVGCKGYICLRFNQECIFEALVPNADMYGVTVFNAIQKFTMRKSKREIYPTDADSKRLFERWGHATAPFFLLPEIIGALKHCGPELVKQAVSNSIQAVDSLNSNLLRLFYKFGDVSDEDQRLLVFQACVSVFGVLLNYHTEESRKRLEQSYSKCNRRNSNSTKILELNKASASWETKYHELQAEFSRFQEYHKQQIIELEEKLQVAVTAKHAEQVQQSAQQETGNSKPSQSSPKDAGNNQAQQDELQSSLLFSPEEKANEAGVTGEKQRKSADMTSLKFSSSTISQGSQETRRGSTMSLSATPLARGQPLQRKSDFSSLSERNIKSPVQPRGKALKKKSKYGLAVSDKDGFIDGNQSAASGLPVLFDRMVDNADEMSRRMHSVQVKMDFLEKTSITSLQKPPFSAKTSPSSSPVHLKTNQKPIFKSSIGGMNKNDLPEMIVLQPVLVNHNLQCGGECLTSTLEENFKRILNKTNFNSEEASNEIVALAGALEEESEILQQRKNSRAPQPFFDKVDVANTFGQESLTSINQLLQDFGFESIESSSLPPIKNAKTIPFT